VQDVNTLFSILTAKQYHPSGVGKVSENCVETLKKSVSSNLGYYSRQPLKMSTR